MSNDVQKYCASHIETWSKDIHRLEEDASQEEGLLETAYRSKQIVELVQNGAGAMTESAGRMEVRLTRDALYVANEGTPLTADGVKALLYMRLSEKQDEQIGRLGVGFKSVLEVTDNPYILSRSLSLSFSRSRSEELIRMHVPNAPKSLPAMRLA